MTKKKRVYHRREPDCFCDGYPFFRRRGELFLTFTPAHVWLSTNGMQPSDPLPIKLES